MMFQKTKGTEDFFPQERADQQWVFGCWKQAARCFAFNEVEPPILEGMKLLTAKSGDEIRDQIFVLEKRSREELGLRFEFTAGAARMFVSRQKEIAKPVKWFSVGPVWRYEQPQAGRMREFFQFNAEIYGARGMKADAEVIMLAADALKSLGLKESDFFVRVNNRKLLQGMLDFVPKAKLEDTIRVIDKKEKISGKQFLEELSFLGEDKAQRLKKMLEMQFSELVPENQAAKDGYEEMAEVLRLLPNAVFDLSTARGLAYYTGTVFEIFDKEKKYRALCGGGRYDTMIELFGGEKTPATGFGMGYSTVSLLLKEKGILPRAMLGPDYFVASVAGADIMPIVAKLRKKHSVAYDLNERNLGNQMKYANSIAADKVIVIGPEELEKKSAKVKDMKSGKEATMRL